MSRQSSGSKQYKAQPPFKIVEGLGTDPWKRLSRNGAYVLDRLYCKFTTFNRGNLSVTFREVKGKMSNRLFSAGILEVVCFGFADIVREGGLKRQCNIYRLSDHWRRLQDKPEKLDKIESILKEIEILKRKKGNPKKRMKIRQLTKEALNLSRI